MELPVRAGRMGEPCGNTSRFDATLAREQRALPRGTPAEVRFWNVFYTVAGTTLSPGLRPLDGRLGRQRLYVLDRQTGYLGYLFMCSKPYCQHVPGGLQLI